MKLILDLAFRPIVALENEGKIIKEIESENEHSSDLVMKDIDKLFSDCNTNLDSVDTIAVNVGPGSFTGLRVAIAIAKGFNILHDKKFEVFSSFDYIQTQNVNVVEAFSNYVYAKSANGMDCVLEGDLAQEKLETCQKELFEKLKETHNIALVPKRGYEQITKNQPKVLSENLRPMYLRKSQAELARENSSKNAK